MFKPTPVVCFALEMNDINGHLVLTDIDLTGGRKKTGPLLYSTRAEADASASETNENDRNASTPSDARDTFEESVTVIKVMLRVDGALEDEFGANLTRNVALDANHSEVSVKRVLAEVYQAERAARRELSVSSGPS